MSGTKGAARGMPPRREPRGGENRTDFRCDGGPLRGHERAKWRLFGRAELFAGPLDGSTAIHLYFNDMGDPIDTQDEVAALLRRHGINPTRQRLEIARALFSRTGHLSADQVLAAVNGRRPATSKATVYNTLNLFRDRGLIREVIANPNKVFYDPNTAPHHHFYDVDTGELTDIDARTVEVRGLPALPEGTVTEGVDIIVRIRSTAG
jgi:Fur family iron response transcriptional regulator